jgi:GWxTD domain-containing protein
MRLLKPLSLFALLGIGSLNAQPQNPAVLTDALVFHGPEITGKELVDVYVSVPYQTLQFQQYDNRYAATFVAKVVLRDSIGRKLADTTINKSRVVETYAAAQGATGGSENTIVRFAMPPGSYRLEVAVRDQLSHREFAIPDSVRVPDLSNAPALSSVMYVSQIEEHDGRYKITPYVGSTIWSGELQLFAFFESYLEELPQTVAFSWNVTALDGRRLGGGLGSPVKIGKRSMQHFLPLRMTERALPGRYTCTVTMHPVADGVADTTVALAVVARPYIVPRTLGSEITSDMTKAVKQLAYVANQTEIDDINAATNLADRQYRFEQFWKKQDPTPATVKNEAFEEYYTRIATANRLYRSYTEGWLTDMGRVYIIYGDPQNKRKQQSSTGVTIYEEWQYADRQLVFEDTMGTGDFRLRTPLPADAKYRYRR